MREAEGMVRTQKMFVEQKLKAVMDNKPVLLPRLVMHAGVIITRCKTVHDGKTAYQRVKNKRPSNKMLPFGEKVVWMMLKDNHRRNKWIRFISWSVRRHRAKNMRIRGSDSAARTVHRLSEDQTWDTEVMSRVQGAPWDFKANFGDDDTDGGIPERAGARPPDPPVEIPSRLSLRRMYTHREVSRLSESHEGTCALMQCGSTQ